MLAAAADDARLIAGGQTLVPLMAMRLARPTQLIDIARIGELAFVRREADAVTVGATTKQCVLERDPVIGADVPLLRRSCRSSVMLRSAPAAHWVGLSPMPIRRPRLCSLPSFSMQRCFIAMAARRSKFAASDFFTGPMMTALRCFQLSHRVRFPIWQEPRIGVGFHEVSARRSDFAFASAGAQIALDENGACRRLALGVGAVTSVPVRLDALAAFARRKDGDTFGGGDAKQARLRAVRRTALAEIEPFPDLHASADLSPACGDDPSSTRDQDAYRAANGRGIRAH